MDAIAAKNSEQAVTSTTRTNIKLLSTKAYPLTQITAGGYLSGVITAYPLVRLPGWEQMLAGRLLEQPGGPPAL